MEDRNINKQQNSEHNEPNDSLVVFTNSEVLTAIIFIKHHYTGTSWFEFSRSAESPFDRWENDEETNMNTYRKLHETLADLATGCSYELIYVRIVD